MNWADPFDATSVCTLFCAALLVITIAALVCGY